jgi:hypothetical protein
MGRPPRAPGETPALSLPRSQASRLVAFKEASDISQENEDDNTPKANNLRGAAADFFPTSTVRRMFTDTVPSASENVLIVDCAADQSCIVEISKSFTTPAKK